MALNTHENLSNDVLVVLVDAAQFLEQFELQFKYPFTVTYKSVQLYSSFPGNADLPFHTNISGYDNLEISFQTENIPESVDATRTNPKSIADTLFSIPLPLIYIIFTLLLGIISFICGRYYRKKNK